METTGTGAAARSPVLQRVEKGATVWPLVVQAVGVLLIAGGVFLLAPWAGLVVVGAGVVLAGLVWERNQ